MSPKYLLVVLTFRKFNSIQDIRLKFLLGSLAKCFTVCLQHFLARMLESFLSGLLIQPIIVTVSKAFPFFSCKSVILLQCILLSRVCRLLTCLRMIALAPCSHLGVILICNLDLNPIGKLSIGHYVLLQFLFVCRPALLKIVDTLVLVSQEVLVSQLLLGDKSEIF